MCACPANFQWMESRKGMNMHISQNHRKIEHFNWWTGTPASIWGLGLCNIVMKPNTGTYHAKFKIQSPSLVPAVQIGESG